VYGDLLAKDFENIGVLSSYSLFKEKSMVKITTELEPVPQVLSLSIYQTVGALAGARTRLGAISMQTPGFNAIAIDHWALRCGSSSAAAPCKCHFPSER
jgi:hypothetical protein